MYDSFEVGPKASAIRNPANCSIYALTASLDELTTFLLMYDNNGMSDEDCVSLAFAAICGHAAAEFLVATVYDAAEDMVNATLWYQRAADKGFVPAQLQAARMN